MKNKFYKSLLIGLSLAILATASHAKSSHAASKKHSPVSAKRNKTPARHGHAHAERHVEHAVSAAKHRTKKHAAPVVVRSRSHKKAKVHTPHYAHLTLKHSRKHRFTHRHRRAQPQWDEALLDAIDTETDSEIDTDINNIDEPSTNRIHSLISADNTTETEYVSTPPTPSSLSSAYGVITSSLARAGEKAGLSDDLIIQLTNIFAWDIDFATNIRRGDHFTVVYEGSGDSGQIVAAEFVSRGRTFTAVRYQDRNGTVNYYSPEGKTMRKAFLSTPVDFARISSHFDSQRKHPILNRIRAHKGVDYAARTGTPVKAAGDGKVSFLGRKGGYGQVMILEHGQHYETLYAHLSNFKRGLDTGDTVRQGEIIGYVGQTGLATGPHLHYEFRIDGIHSNPEALNSDHSSSLNRHLLADFKSKATPVLAQLYHTKARTLFAKNQ